MKDDKLVIIFASALAALLSYFALMCFWETRWHGGWSGAISALGCWFFSTISFPTLVWVSKELSKDSDTTDTTNNSEVSDEKSQMSKRSLLERDGESR